jgi:hypothetical protein
MRIIEDDIDKKTEASGITYSLLSPRYVSYNKRLKTINLLFWIRHPLFEEYH